MNAIGAIFKNEAPYVSEWVAYHKSLGFDKIYIVDNISNDGTSEILSKLHSHGEITRIEYQTIPGIKPQVPAYNLILQKARDECDYITFIDADEFLYFDEGFSLKDLTDLIKSNESVGAIAINWCVYGSSRCILPGPGMVMERFDHRSDQTCHLNLHYKSFLKTSAIRGTQGGGVHHFQLNDGYNYIMTDGSILNSDTGLSSHTSWDICRLNHYVIKSNSEFFHKKMARGRAAGNNSDLNKYFFINHDKNDIRDGFSAKTIEITKHKKFIIDSKIGMNNTISNTSPLYRSLNYSEGRSYIDSIKRDEESLIIDGWVNFSCGDITKAIIMVVNKKDIIPPIEFLKVRRPDVVECGISSYDMCGFNAVFNLSLIVCSSTQHIDLYAVDSSDEVIHHLDSERNVDLFSKLFPNIIGS